MTSLGPRVLDSESDVAEGFGGPWFRAESRGDRALSADEVERNRSLPGLGSGICEEADNKRTEMRGRC